MIMRPLIIAPEYRRAVATARAMMLNVQDFIYVQTYRDLRGHHRPVVYLVAGWQINKTNLHEYLELLRVVEARTSEVNLEEGDFKVLEPYTSTQVININTFQVSGKMHPFTCGNDSSHPVLVAFQNGMFCMSCEYMQDWVWHGMTNGEWSKSV